MSLPENSTESVSENLDKKTVLVHYTLSLVLFTISLIFLYSRKTKNVKRSVGKRLLGLDDIPGSRPPLPIKLTGNLIQLLPISRTIEKALKWNQDYPGLYKCTGIYKTIVVITAAPGVQQLFKSTEFGHNVKAPVVYDLMKPVISNGLLVSSGKFWQGQRKLMMRTQSYASLKGYMGMLNRHSKDFVEQLAILFQDGKPQQINEIINVTFLKVICEMMTGYNTKSSSELDRYHHNFNMWKECLVKRILYPWFQITAIWKLHPMSKQQDQAIEEMFGFARRRVKEHREKKNKIPAEESSLRNPETAKGQDKKQYRCLLDDLIDAGVDDAQIVDEVNTMLFGGHETGATVIHFFCLCIALHPEIQAECRKEVDELFENPGCFHHGEITYEAIQSHLKYVERCINETMRLFPPVFMVLRQLETDFLLEHKGKEYLLPTGTVVVISPLSTQRMPEYFPDPLKFDPDRFLPEETAKRHAYSYIPFSGGPRNCLGLKFALVEMKVVVAYLLRHFEMRTRDRMEDIPLLPYLTLTPVKDYTFEFQSRGFN